MPTPIYIVTFDVCTLPASVNLGWTKCSVRPYIPRPRRCFKCQAFGHGATACRRDSAVCYNCAQEQHELPCNHPPKCANCFEQHPSSSTSCTFYKMEAEILATQTKERTSYHEAKRAVRARNVRNDDTFAQMVRRPSMNENITSDRPTPPAEKPSCAAVKATVSDGCTQTEHAEPADLVTTRDQPTTSMPAVRRTSTAGCGVSQSDLVIPIHSRKRPQGEESPPPDRSVRPKVQRKPALKKQEDRTSDGGERGRTRLLSDPSHHPHSELFRVDKKLLKAFPIPENAPKFLPPTIRLGHWGERGETGGKPPDLTTGAKPTSGNDDGNSGKQPSSVTTRPNPKSEPHPSFKPWK